MGISISQKVNVRLTWYFADGYRASSSITGQGLVTSSKWAWPDDVTNSKMWLFISQDLNVRLSWSFAEKYHVSMYVKMPNIMTVVLAWWRYRLILRTGYAIELNLCRCIYGENCFTRRNSVTSSKVVVPWWHCQFQNVYVLVSETEEYWVETFYKRTGFHGLLLEWDTVAPVITDMAWCNISSIKHLSGWKLRKRSQVTSSLLRDLFLILKQQK